MPLVLEHSWAKVAKTSRKLLKKSAHGDGLRKTGQAKTVFFCFSIGFGPVGFLFRIGVICVKISDRSKLEEWKQIRKQDDFKQTVQNMRVSTLCTLSTSHYPPFCFSYCGLKFGIAGKRHETSTSNV